MPEPWLSDAEVVAEFMEAKPQLPDYWTCTQKSRGGWWELVAIAGGGMRWYALFLTLGRLRLVQMRLDKDQWADYQHEVLKLWESDLNSGNQVQFALHLSAEQKTAALAAVLRQQERGGGADHGEVTRK